MDKKSIAHQLLVELLVYGKLNPFDLVSLLNVTDLEFLSHQFAFPVKW